MIISRQLVFLLLLCLTCTTARSEEPNPATSSGQHSSPGLLPNLVAPTWGGTQFWSDQLIFREWRIQQNVITDHCRLLDGQDRRQAWGSFESCLQRLEQLKTQRQLPPITSKVVITLHGLGDRRAMMASTSEYLAEEGDYTPINVSYASTRCSLDDHARSLARIIDRLDQASQIDFVCHSMGNLVVQRYLHRASQTAVGIDPRITRMVMLGPPNQGASLARHFDQLALYGLLLGPSARQLASDPQVIRSQLKTPPFQFAIIAGSAGGNPLLIQANDFTVTVEETQLAGASDFQVLPVLHFRMMNDPTCQQCVLRFLEHGYLLSADKRRALSQ